MRWSDVSWHELTSEQRTRMFQLWLDMSGFMMTWVIFLSICRLVIPSPLQSCQVGRPYDVTWHQNKASVSQLWLDICDIGDVMMTLTCRPLVRLNNALAETESHINLSQITSGIVFLLHPTWPRILSFELKSSSFELKISPFELKSLSFELKNSS